MRLTTTLSITRAQGVLVDALTGLLLGAAVAQARGGSWRWAAAGTMVGLLLSARWTKLRAVRALERRLPETRHALAAWHEGTGGALRPRLEAWLEARVRPVLLPSGAARVALALGIWLLLPPMVRAPAARPTSPEAPNAKTAGLEVQVQIDPPAASGLEPFSSPGPTVEAMKGSAVRVRWLSGAPAVLVAEPGQPALRLEVKDGAAVQTFTLDRGRTLRAQLLDGSPPRVLVLVARADAPPEVELVQPGEDRVVTSAPSAIELRAEASDDLGLKRVSLQYSLAQGSGEAMHFKAGRLPGAAQGDGRHQTLRARVDPVKLGMAAGDTLALWGEAEDSNSIDGPAVTRSGARLLRWEVPLPELSGGSGAMPTPPRALLSQRELLARTERLVRSGVKGQALERTAAELAQDQHDLRVSFSQVLNTESGAGLQLDVDEKEVAESTDVKAHASLAQAVSAMWDAESQLSVNAPRLAVPPMKAAVAALDAAFSLVRMSLRPLAQPDKPVDERRRLTGSAKGLSPRALPPLTGQQPDPRAVELGVGLLTAAAKGLDGAEARALGDALWALPAAAGLPNVELATALYGAATPEGRVEAARLAGETLARALRPARLTTPAFDVAGARVLSSVPLKLPR